MERKLKSAIISFSALMVIILCTILLVAQSKKHKNKSHSNPKSLMDSVLFLNKRDSIIGFAKTLLGTPYTYGSCSKDGFDCSGFVYFVFKKFNIDVSRSSYTIGEKGVEIDTIDAMKGDIILFQGTDLNDPKIGHVGIVISDKGKPIEFIHASSSTKNNGVIVTRLDAGHYRKRFIKVIKVL